MDDFKKQLKKSLTNKNIGGVFISSLCISLLEDYFNKKHKINGYVKNGILFVKANGNFIKNDIYLQKKPIIEYINEKIKNFDITDTIKDIKFK